MTQSSNCRIDLGRTDPKSAIEYMLQRMATEGEVTICGWVEGRRNGLAECKEEEDGAK